MKPQTPESADLCNAMGESMMREAEAAGVELMLGTDEGTEGWPGEGEHQGHT